MYRSMEIKDDQKGDVQLDVAEPGKTWITLRDLLKITDSLHPHRIKRLIKETPVKNKLSSNERA